MTLKALSLVALATSFAAVTAQAATVPVQSSQGKVEFHAVGRPSMIKVNGEGKGPEGTLTLDGAKVGGDLTFDMTSLSSGISMRDEHMKNKYLEVQKYPQAKLHLTEVTLPANWSAKAPAVKEAAFKGELTMHGQTKPVAGKFDLAGDASKMNAKANFEINIADFGVEIPKYLGITVKNEVPVELTLNDLKAK
jgi:polyisoprenoid-binding protein YceI